MKMQMKNRSHGSHRYDINRPWNRHGHEFSEYQTCLSMMATFQAQFMKKLSNTEIESKKKRCL